jgi:hypothetical protein
MAYVPPIFTDPNGKSYEGKEASEKALKRFSDMGILSIPNRPFSGKPIKFIAGKNPPDGDYRLPLSDDELELLRTVVPGLSIRVVDSTPELSDPRLELFLREYYHMGDSRIDTLTWTQILHACQRYLASCQGEEDELKRESTGLKSGGPAPPKKRPPGVLNQQVTDLIKAGERSSTRMEKILNNNYVGTYLPTSRKSIEGTAAYTKICKKKKKS